MQLGNKQTTARNPTDEPHRCRSKRRGRAASAGYYELQPNRVAVPQLHRDKQRRNLYIVDPLEHIGAAGKQPGTLVAIGE